MYSTTTGYIFVCFISYVRKINKIFPLAFKWLEWISYQLPVSPFSACVTAKSALQVCAATDKM